MDSIVHLKELTVSHENGILLSNVTLDIREGEFVYLIGKSGAGKTSLLRSLYADRPIDGGEVEVCGFDVAHLKRRQIPQLRRSIGIVFQNFFHLQADVLFLLPPRSLEDEFEVGIDIAVVEETEVLEDDTNAAA